MAAALGPLQKVPMIRYKICPSNLRNMPIRPTNNAYPTYEKCPSDLRKMPIRPTKLSGRPRATINYFIPYCARHMTKAAEL